MPKNIKKKINLFALHILKIKFSVNTYSARMKESVKKHIIFSNTINMSK